MLKKDQQEHADMENNRSKIELRSKKIRSIIGLEPSWMVQWGITIIAVIVAIILLAGYYVFFQYGFIRPIGNKQNSFLTMLF